jgi:hypothetical protein
MILRWAAVCFTRRMSGVRVPHRPSQMLEENQVIVSLSCANPHPPLCTNRWTYSVGWMVGQTPCLGGTRGPSPRPSSQDRATVAAQEAGGSPTGSTPARSRVPAVPRPGCGASPTVTDSPGPRPARAHTRAGHPRAVRNLPGKPDLPPYSDPSLRGVDPPAHPGIAAIADLAIGPGMSGSGSFDVSRGSADAAGPAGDEEAIRSHFAEAALRRRPLSR